MKKFLVVLVICAFTGCVWAELPERKIKNLPEGTFRKTRNGTIVQYDKNGKKIGTYKMNNRKYVKVK